MAADARAAEQRPVPPAIAVCSRCEENLLTSSKESILLSCLHVFCKLCIRAGCLPRIGDGNVIECPKCKAKCQKQDIGCCLFFMSNESDKNEEKCVACDENLNATSLCVQCDEMLCEACVQAHKRVRITKDHTIRPLSANGGSQDAKPIFCLKHTNEKMRFFCEPCDKLSCRLCHQEFHRDHKYCFLNEAAERFRQQLKAKVKLVDGKINSLKGASALINQRLKALSDSEERVSTQITEFFVRLRETIDKIEKSLYADLKAVAQSKRQSLQNKHDDIDTLLKRIHQYKEIIDYAADCGSDTALLCTRRPFLVHLHDLVGAKCQVPNPTHVLDICFQYDPQLLAQLTKLGTILLNNQPIEYGLEQRRANGTSLSIAASEAVSSGSSTVECSNLEQAGADAVSATTPSNQAASCSKSSSQEGQVLNQQALQPKSSGQGQAGSATVKLDSVQSPLAVANVTHQSGVAGVSGAAISRPADTCRIDGRQRATEANAGRSANGNAPPGTLQDSKDPITCPRVRGESRSERSCAMPEATASTRMDGPDVCAADSSHSPRRLALSARQDDISVSAGKLERGQLARETEADSAAGQDQTCSDLELISITNVRSLASSAAETADTTTNGSSTGVTARSHRWSPHHVANNHKPEDHNEDYCAVCHNGGELMCCDTCPKVYHVQCHVPELALPFSAERWSCSLCIQEARGGSGGGTAASAAAAAASAAAAAQSEEPSLGKRKAPLGLTDVELKLCEHILLKLFCYKGSLAFHFPVQKTVPNYYRMIKEPMDFTSIKKKLLRQHFNHYMTFSEFIADINLVFANCQTYNPPGSELAQAATALHSFFVELVRQLMPHLVDEAKKLRKPEDVMHKSALKKKKTDGEPPVHIC